MPFSSKADMRKYLRENIEVEFLSRGNRISNMKTASTKNCTLCMAERVNLFCNFEKLRRNRGHKTLNSRTELHAKCNFKTRFLRLYTVGSPGTDEAT